MNSSCDSCEYNRKCFCIEGRHSCFKIEKLEEENKKLKQWDVNKDTRNSRQRIANAKNIKRMKKLLKMKMEIFNYIKEQLFIQGYTDLDVGNDFIEIQPIHILNILGKGDDNSGKTSGSEENM